MTEDFLQYIWRYNLFINDYSLNTEIIDIINVGQLNTDSGPDFFNSKIKIGDTLWVGNVEIHKKSSDWFLHKHNINSAYNNVILHVVEKIDKIVFDSNGRKIPQIELKYDKKIFDNYSKLKNSNHKIKCENSINEINSFDLHSWQDTILLERLERKSTDIENLLKLRTNDWEEVFYIMLLRYFGTNVNSEPFEMLSRSLPLKYILQQNNNLLSVESLLFGQAGFLNTNINIKDDYFNSLKKEYLFMKNKYSLSPIDVSNWKFMRIRPASFPTIRIAQASSLLQKNTNFFSKIINTSKIKDIHNLFDVGTSSYWDTHYKFGLKSAKRNKKLGQQTINLIIINVIVPILFVFGKQRNIEKYIKMAISFLHEIDAENNSIIRYWNNIGIETKDAYETQAMLELYKAYCHESRCLNCRIGNRLIHT